MESKSFENTNLWIWETSVGGLQLYSTKDGKIFNINLDHYRDVKVRYVTNKH